MNPDAALTFLDFVQARHQVWARRQKGESPPWTTDPIVASRKFTNVFRLLDYGSQFVLTDLIDPELDPVDQLLRLFLYRHTGRVEPWQYLNLTSGYPTRANLDDVVAAWKEYRGGGYPVDRGDNPSRNAAGATWTKFERPVFTGAYLVFPQSTVAGTDKLDAIIDLTHRLFIRQDVGGRFLDVDSQVHRFKTLRENKGVADFMSMQILTDWGYTTDFRENDFIVLGPGARKGCAALGAPAIPATVAWVADNISHLKLGERSPSWMDAQNTLCEFSKYVRYQTKTIPAKPYQPAHPGPQPAPVLPQHW